MGVLRANKVYFVDTREGRGNFFLWRLNITLKHLNSTGSKGPFVIVKSIVNNLWALKFQHQESEHDFSKLLTFGHLEGKLGKLFF